VKALKIRALLGVAVLSGLWAATPAYAVPISDTVDPDPSILITFTGTPTPCPSPFTCSVANLSWVHDITDNGFSVLDTIISASLVVHLTDTGGSEKYTYTIGLGQTQSEMNVGATETDTVILTAPSITDLLDGTIGVTLTHTGAPGSSPATSFSYADSTLTVEVTKFVALPDPEPERTVPVPSSLFLLGVGLAILVGRSRRRI
jgi:PEP-CTERM motif-containing protein